MTTLRTALGFAALLLIAGLAGAQSGPRITEGAVRGVVEKTMAAANRRDADAIVQWVAPDAVLVLDFKGADGKTQRLKMSRTRYLQHLRDAFTDFPSYAVRLDRLEITVAPDGQSAVARGRVRETMHFNGTTRVFSVETTSTYALREGRPLLTDMRSYVR